MFAVGRIELIFGPMFAGKTTEMLRRISRCEMAHKRCRVYKYSFDQRYSADKVSTHDYFMHDAISCTTLMPHFMEAMSYDVIGIDEGQFFPDIVVFADQLANAGKIVFISALDGDYLRKPFGNVGELISKCESVIKLTAICRVTGEEAVFTERTVKSDQLELIGGAESYTSSSRTAWKKFNTSGCINLTIGPVKSGKTTELTRLLVRHKIAGKKVIMLVNHEVDTTKVPVEVRVINALPDLASMQEYDVIGVDDGHLYEGIAEWADDFADHNKKVMVAAADGDEFRNPYPHILKLFSFAESVRKIDSICMVTGNPAPFTARIDGKLVPISRLGIMSQNSINSYTRQQ